MSATLVWTLVKPRRGTGGLIGIQITASAIACTLAFATAILANRFWTAHDPTGGYRILAIALVGLLIVPLVTLGSSAARLAVRSRDDQLATLRLIGMRARKVRTIAVIESTLIQTAGVAIGFLLSLPLPHVLKYLPIQGHATQGSNLALPPIITAGILASLVLIAAISAQLGLRSVLLTPLGVRQRTTPPRLTMLRLIVAIVAIIGGTLLLRLASPSWGAVGLIVALIVAVIVVMGVLSIVGPYAIALSARRRATDAATLIATKRNLDDPKGIWRLVSSVALTSFILIPAGSMLGFLDAVRRGPSRLSEDIITLLTDARTMLLILVAVSFIIVACQIAFTQSAALLEHRDLYIALDRIGMPLRTINQARRKQIITPALIAIIGSAAAAAVLAFPLVAVATAASPAFIALTLALLGIGIIITLIGVEATNPILKRMLAKPQRGE